MESVLIALIAAAAPSSLAFLAWKQSKSASERVATTNGQTAGAYVEQTAALVELLIERQTEAKEAMGVHIADDQAQFKAIRDEQTRVAKVQAIEGDRSP